MRGLLLINLGSPDEPTTPAVRRYLREFLSDPRVIDINPVGRALMLHLFILPFRPAKSAELYRKVWTDAGSPLLVHGRALAERVQAALGDGWRVELAMRYGNPSIAAAMDRLAAAERIVVFPLYPQYAASSTGSSVEEAFRVAGSRWVVPPLSVVGDFYADPGFLDAFAAVGAPVVADGYDHVLFSFHGLPERQIRKADASGAHCLARPDCCDRIDGVNRSCYRAQCYATAAAIAGRLALARDRWSVAFQSRLGRTPWIRPYTDEVLPQLAAAGKVRVAVFCPAFVADCLETLEEIGLRAQQPFRAAGGEKLTLVPSLNSSPRWVETVTALARAAAPE
ncbi:MAG TPA: ferrochelatase [Haliangiales bacterium]|nr:ferrochelatase [Haliangiales bacterium]